jgi:hypothetical protein
VEAEDVSNAKSPSQKTVGPFGVTVGVGLALTCTAIAVELPTHPLASVTVTIYEPEVVTRMDCVVDALLHKYEVAADAINVTEPPSQNVVGPPGVTVGLGFGYTVIVIGVELPKQPIASVTVTLYAPDVASVID